MSVAAPRLQKFLYFALTILLGVAFFAISIGFQTLSAQWFTWLYSSSREQYQSAWLAYAQAPWSFPLGELPLLFYPHGSTVAFMDGAPWYLTFLKLINPILPKYVSAWGWWILLCCIFQATSARRLMQCFTAQESVRWIGTMLLTFSPVFVQRNVHFALMAQGFILLAWSFFFEERGEQVSRRWQWLFLLAVVAGIHPYLTAMVLALRLGALAIQSIPTKIKIQDLLASFLVVGFVFYIFSYFQNGTTADVGADYFSADLGTFIISQGTSFLFPSLASRAGEQEGYGYFGAGVLLLIAATFIFNYLSAKAKVTPTIEGVTTSNEYFSYRIKSAFIVAGILLIFSFGSHLRLFGFDPFEKAHITNPMYFLFFGKLKSIPLIFRAPGRFCWPFYYLVIAYGSTVCSRKMVLLYVALFLQCIDVGPYITDRHSRLTSGKKPDILTNDFIVQNLRSAKAINFIPLEPRIACGLEPYQETFDLMKGVLPIAAQNNIPFNSGLQARIPVEPLKQLCDQQLTDFKEGRITLGAVYIVDNQYLMPEMLDSEHYNLSCSHFADVSICLGETPARRHWRLAHFHGRLNQS